MQTSSIKSRFAITVFANFLRSSLSFVTGLIIARSLGADSYGDYSFLLASFIAINQTLTLGTPNAFYTFMSQKPRGRKFVTSYAAWQLFLFFIPLAVIGLFFPKTWINLIWLGQQKELVLFSFAAVFMQQQAWQTVIQIGESMRLTYRVQLINLCLAVAHIILVTAIWQLGFLSPKVLFMLIAAEYAIAILISSQAIPLRQLSDDPLDGKAVFEKYRTYCTPLILYSFIGFAYSFADRWLLQNFGGSKEQGFYSIGFQFSVISLLATGSILNIFWKEISEAQEMGDNEKMFHLYKKVCRFVYFSAIVISALLIPWSEEIARIALGPTFAEGHMVLSVMFLYSAHRALEMVNGSMLLATGQTRFHLISGGTFMATSIPISYFIQAPADAMIPGFELGAMGMAIKVIFFSVIMVNIITWWIGKQFGKSLDWTYQVVGMVGTLLLSWLAFSLGKQIATGLSLGLYLQAGVACLLYFPMVATLLWQFPWIAGTSREEMRSILIRAKILRNAPFGE